MSQIELDEESEQLRKDIDEGIRRVQARRDEFRGLYKAPKDNQAPNPTARFSFRPFTNPPATTNPPAAAAAPPQTSLVWITDLGPDGTLKPQVGEAKIKHDDAWVRELIPQPQAEASPEKQGK